MKQLVSTQKSYYCLYILRCKIHRPTQYPIPNHNQLFNHVCTVYHILIQLSPPVSGKNPVGRRWLHATLLYDVSP